MNREIAPLKKAADGIELDSTGKTIPMMVQEIVGYWNQRKGT
jgi:cytidylate kinase